MNNLSGFYVPGATKEELEKTKYIESIYNQIIDYDNECKWEDLLPGEGFFLEETDNHGNVIAKQVCVKLNPTIVNISENLSPDFIKINILDFFYNPTYKKIHHRAGSLDVNELPQNTKIYRGKISTSKEVLN